MRAIAQDSSSFSGRDPNPPRLRERNNLDTKRLFDSQAERAPTFDAWRWPALER
jgi:hypothetical protein